jgi:hypothetical protein
VSDLREDIIKAIDLLQNQTYRATQLVVSPRAAYALRLWYRWIHLTRNIVWADPRWPRFIWRRLHRRRRRKAEERFARWVARHPYIQQPLAPLPNDVVVSKWLPPEWDAVEFDPNAFEGLRGLLVTRDRISDALYKGPSIADILKGRD